MGVVFQTDGLSCSFCGARPSAHWSSGETDTYCCSSCAVGILPAMAADAILGKHADNPAIQKILGLRLHAMERTFWRACVMAIRYVGETKREAARATEEVPY